MIKILMLEDDELIADLLSRYLSQYANVTHLIYPLDALKLLDSENFDIIILDLTLPQLDGLEVCKMMKKVSEAKIIISSARSDINDKLFALENGADDYLPKPYDPRELYARIKLLHVRDKRVKKMKWLKFQMPLMKRLNVLKILKIHGHFFGEMLCMSLRHRLRKVF